MYTDIEGYFENRIRHMSPEVCDPFPFVMHTSQIYCMHRFNSNYTGFDVELQKTYRYRHNTETICILQCITPKQLSTHNRRR